ncbi:MAG: tyrosine-type recombinase/integrase [Eubacterium sp.]|nr:tyrosine-type recombinase/integrase [Eubacterium sp.]
MKNKDFAYHLTKFFTIYLPSQRNLSKGTISTYRDVFKLLLLFMNDEKRIKPQKITLDNLHYESITEFIEWLKNERNCSPKTCNQRLAAIKSFCNYLQFEDPERAYQCKQILEIRYKKAPETELQYLTVDGIKKILEQPDVTTRNGRRDLAILSIMYDTGARVQEIADLRLKNLRLIAPATVSITGKGGKTRIVPMLSKTEKIITQYINDFHLQDQGENTPLFQNRNNEKLTRYGISYILNKYVEMARGEAPELIPDKISPHSFRHSKAMHLLQANVNMVYIRDLLGHSSITTTEVYARADSTQKREALEKADPFKDRPSMPQWKDDEGLMEWLRSLV